MENYCNSYRRRGIEMHLFELPTDFPCHIFMALGIQHSGDGPFCVAGLGADFDPADAAGKALLEVGQVRPGLKQRLRTGETQNRVAELIADYKMVKDLEDHDLLFSSKAFSGELDYLLDQPVMDCDWSRWKLNDMEKLERLLMHLKSIDSDLIYYNLTPSDMQGLGLYTARVILPDIQPIHFGYEKYKTWRQAAF